MKRLIHTENLYSPFKRKICLSTSPAAAAGDSAAAVDLSCLSSIQCWRCGRCKASPWVECILRLQLFTTPPKVWGLTLPWYPPCVGSVCSQLGVKTVVMTYYGSRSFIQGTFLSYVACSRTNGHYVLGHIHKHVFYDLFINIVHLFRIIMYGAFKSFCMNPPWCPSRSTTAYYSLRPNFPSRFSSSVVWVVLHINKLQKKVVL